MKVEHLSAMVSERARLSPDGVAFRIRKGNEFVSIPWSDVASRVEALAVGILAGTPLDEGACVTIIGNTSMDWVIADFAVLRVGLKSVPIYASLLPEEVGYMHVDTQAQLVVAENAAQLQKVRAMRDGFKFFDTKYERDRIAIRGKVIVIDPAGLAPADDWESLADVEARGREQLSKLKSEVARRTALMKRDHVATYTYTSGTTGPPKAVIQTHDNMLSMLESVASTGLFDERTQQQGLFLFLPLAHSFGRLIELAAPFFGAPLVISSVPTLAEDLGLSRPGFFPGAPRVYEKMMSKVMHAIDTSPPRRKSIARWALEVGRQANVLAATGQPVPMFLSIKHIVADRLVLSKLRARLGLDQASILLSGSAPLRTDVHEFFLAAGLTLIEAYGLTETCPGLTSNRPGNMRIGTVGQAFEGVTLKIASDGEILAKGPNITSGYLNRDDATSEAFPDGWFHTGDLGALEDGFLRITGRKKELLKTSGGKYIAPNKIEALLKPVSFVQEAVVIGDNRNYCTAVFALDREMLTEYAKQEGIDADPKHERVRAALQSHVDTVNHTLASFEQIKYFCVVPEPFTVEGGELTASLKVKRKVVLEKYSDLIDSMYSPGSPG